MAVTNKVIDLTNTDFKSEQEYAEKTNGIYMNMLNGIRWDPIDNKFKIAPIKYSDIPLEGEKIRFANNQELQVIFSCLASEFANKQEVRDKWWARAEKLKKDYIEQAKLDSYLKSSNTDLRKLRSEGALKDQDEVKDE